MKDAQFRLRYFPIHARGLAIRLLFRLGEVPFVDEHIKRSDWPSLKSGTPWGTLPVLHHGDAVIFDTCAITQYVARHTGHWPQDPVGNAKSIALINAVDDSWTMLSNVIKPRNPLAVAWRFKQAVFTDLPELCAHFEDNFEGDFLLGDELTAADLSAYALFMVAQARAGKFGVNKMLSRHPRMNAMLLRVGQMTQVADAVAEF